MSSVAHTTTDLGASGASGEAVVTRVALRFPASLVYRPVAIDLVSVLVQQVVHADRDFRNEVVTAFGEAFNNIVIHGYRGRVDGMIEIEAEMAPDRMTLRLIDTGQPVAFDLVKAPDLESLPESGMGVFMIHSLIDDVKYSGGPPNVLSLCKRTTSASTQGESQ
jgi:serine/threonine-protein kinase RsbW